MRPAIRLLPLLVLVPLLVAGCAQTEDFSGKMVFDGDYVVEEGSTLEGNLVIFDGTVDIEEDALVDGDVVMFSGDLLIDGEVDGDVFAFSGDLELGPTAEVTGDVSNLSEDPEVHSKAVVGGSTGQIAGIPPLSVATPDISAGQTFLGWLVRVLAPAILAALIAAIWPRNVLNAANTAVNEPMAAGLVGILTVIVGVPLLLILVITCCFAWLVPIGLGILLIATLFGWAGLGAEIGSRIGPSLGREYPLSVTTGAGTLILMFVLGLIELIPCIGPVISLMVACVAIGVALLTRFGTRDYSAREIG